MSERPKVTIDNSAWAPGDEVVVQFVKPWATASSNAGKYRTRFTMPGAAVPVPPPVVPPPVVPPTPARPFPLPTITKTVTAPSTVKTTADLQSFVDNQASQTKILCPGNYTGAYGLNLGNRHDLDIDIAAMTTTDASDTTNGSAFKVDKNAYDLRLRVGMFAGANKGIDTDLFVSGRESGMGLCVYDGHRIELHDSNISHTTGDAVFVASLETAGSNHQTSSDVWVHDSSFDFIGRMGIVPKGVRNFIFERNKLDHIALIAIDIEQDYDFELADGLYIRENTFGSYGHSTYQTNWWLAASLANKKPNLAATLANLWVERNQVTVGNVRDGGRGPLALQINKNTRTKGVHILGNTGPAGSSFDLARIDVLDYRSKPNTGPINASVVDCTGVTP